MRHFYLLLCCFLLNYNINAQRSMNMELLAQWNNTSLTTIDGDQLWNDIGGYYDSISKKEYAILLGNDSFYFFDVSKPTLTKLVTTFNGYSKRSINRDVEIYDHYAYFVSERSGSFGGLQILDLQYLPDSVHEVYRSDALSVQAHTIFVEAKSKRLYICQNSLKNGFSAMDILSIENPELPTRLASLQIPVNGFGQPQFSKVHEMFGRNDTVYLSCYEAGLFIIDLTNLDNQKLLGTITNYPNNGTNHSSWLNEKGDKIMFTDENLGSPIKIFDISDISNPKQIVYFNSHPNALPHNAYWKKNMAIVSSYEDGVYVYDLSDPLNPKTHAFYDTYTLNENGTFTGFHGCWGVWPYLPSGNILASDISEGLFVLKLKNEVGVKNINKSNAEIKIFPNPTSNVLNFNCDLTKYESVLIYDVQGQVILSEETKNAKNQLNLTNFKPGIYFCKFTGDGTPQTLKLLVN